MAEICRVVIKGSSGYCSIYDAYNDKVTITQDSISYEYVPYKDTAENPKRKWSYKTSSPTFKAKYNEIARLVSDVIKNKIDEECTDIGVIEFNITFDDTTRFKGIYWVPSDYFAELFKVIKSLVPACEQIPEVLLTSDDYRDEE